MALFNFRKKENIYEKIVSAFGDTYESKFAKDIFTKQKRSYHKEMSLCKKNYRENALIHSSIETMVDLIKGDGFFIETKNQLLKTYLEERGFLESGFYEAVDVAIREALITGNGYIEVVLDENGNIKKFLPFVNSEDIYIDYDYKTNTVKRYIQKLYLEPNIKRKSYSIKTPYGYETVTGEVIPKENLIHIKLGNSGWGVYGRSDIASVLDDIRILDTIERSIAVISKYKAIPKKALMIEKRDGEAPLSEKELQYLSTSIKNSSDFENPILNRKLEALDLSNGGSEINLQPYIDYLKRKITVSLAPEFLIHGQEVNRATSREQKQTYFLRIASRRALIEPILTKVLRNYINGLEQPDLLAQFRFRFGEFDIVLPEEKEKNIQDRWQKGLITLKEARQELGLEPLEGTDYFITELNQATDIFGNEPEN